MTPERIREIMRTNIIILSQNNHSFLINEIKYASEIFQKVIVICPENHEFTDSIKDLSNIEVFAYTKTKLKLYVINLKICQIHI